MVYPVSMFLGCGRFCCNRRMSCVASPKALSRRKAPSVSKCKRKRWPGMEVSFLFFLSGVLNILERGPACCLNSVSSSSWEAECLAEGVLSSSDVMRSFRSFLAAWRPLRETVVAEAGSVSASRVSAAVLAAARPGASDLPRLLEALAASAPRLRLVISAV